MRKIFCLGLALMAAFVVEAKSVVFTLTDGTLVYYLLSNTSSAPIMQMREGGIVVNADAYEFTQIKNFYISSTDDPMLTGVAGVQKDEAPTFAGGVLTLKAVDVNAVKVYDAAGAEVNAVVNVVGDGVTVSLQHLGKGTYVVNTGSASFKVMKR